MSKGLGRIQRGCLRVLGEYAAAGKRPTMLNIASEVYRVRPDRLSDDATCCNPGGRWRVFGRRALFPDKGIFSSLWKSRPGILVRKCRLGSDHSRHSNSFPGSPSRVSGQAVWRSTGPIDVP